MTTVIPSSEQSALAMPVWRPCGATHVAVYGTLRAGGANDMARVAPGIVATGRTTLTGTLYDLGWYPGLRLQGHQQVLAEVYPMDAALEQTLDRYECVWPADSGEYVKRVLTVPVVQPGGGSQTLAVLVYEAVPAVVAGAAPIAASDWLAWVRTHKPEAAARVHPSA